MRTRPIFHSSDAAIRGHVFCSFLALAMQKHLDDLLRQAGLVPEWKDLLRDLDRLQEATIEKDGKSEIEVELKYFDGAPVIKEVQRVSKPGRRVYASVATLPSVFNGLGISILSTPKGVMSDQEARAQNVGGEVLCTVF